MHTPSQDHALLDKRRENTVREKAEVISPFLYECVELATWQEWLAFLHKHQANGFGWTESMD